MLRTLLEDPEKLRTIAGLASGLLGSTLGSFSPTQSQEDAVQASALSQPASYGGESAPPLSPKTDGRYADRINLLRSLRPFVGGGRQSKIDGLIGALSAANVIESYKSSGFGILGSSPKNDA